MEGLEVIGNEEIELLDRVYDLLENPNEIRVR